jgi:16S rRNA (guanine527-N7)-methyltransferase
MLHIKVSEEQLKQYVTYYEMVVEKNKYMNLTAITEFEEFIDKHFIDSLSIVKCMDISQIDTLIDVGTGAGFPGIPLKIAFPHLKVTLLDSLNKRVMFLNDVIDTLHLQNVTTCHGRAEDFGHRNEFREHYDLCTSRAVANLSTLSEYCLPFVNIGGKFISYKSGNVDSELNNSLKAIRTLGGEIEEVCSYMLPDTEFSRTLVPVVKLRSTAKKYPRKAGTPSKEPIQ